MARGAGDPRPQAPPPTPADQTALATFITANRERAFVEEAAAVLERERLQARLVAILTRIDEARPRSEARARLELPGAAGRMVRVSYRVADVRWAPAYRLDVVRGQATLVSLAQVDVGHGDRWDGADLAFTTRAAGRGLVLPPLAVAQLGVADAIGAVAQPREAIGASGREEAMAESELGGSAAFMAIGAGDGASGMFGNRSGGGKKRAVARHGGSKEGQSAVDTALRWAKGQQRGDGTWGSEPFTTASTALTILTYLGAGYDHRMPSRYRNSVRLGLDALLVRQPAQLDLAGLALATCALAEAYAMSNDPDLKAPTEERLAALLARGIAGGEVATWLNRGQAFAGPEILAWLMAAGKSAQAASLTAGGDLLEQVRVLAPLVARHSDADEARLAAGYVAIMAGQKGQYLAPAEVQRLIARAPTLLQRGRVELIYLATIICFQQGGEAWDTWNTAMRARLVPDQRGEGVWSYPHPAGEAAASALATLSLETYYRYSRVGSGPAAAGIPRSEPDLPDAASASHGWPVRWTASGVTLTPGQRTIIEIARTPLSGEVKRRAIPVFEPTVWRSLPTRNPLPQPLPEGDCQLRFEGVALGSTRLPFAAPGAPFTIPLGSDEQVRVVRTSQAASDDGIRTRTLTVDVTFRLESAAGWSGSVEIIEPLPRPVGDAVEVTLRTPALAGKALAQRLEADPFFRAEIGPGAAAILGWQVRYSAALRPFLEFE